MVHEYDGASISPRRGGAERGHSFAGQQLARTIVIVKTLGGPLYGNGANISPQACGSGQVRMEPA